VFFWHLTVTRASARRAKINSFLLHRLSQAPSHQAQDNVEELECEKDCNELLMLLSSTDLYAILHFPSETNDEMRLSEPSKHKYRMPSGKLAVTQKGSVPAYERWTLSSDP
jgi:hypothetical protein